MEAFSQHIRQSIVRVLEKEFGCQSSHVSSVAIETPKHGDRGDFTTNAALVLAKKAGVPPIVFAKALVKALQTHSLVKEVGVAGPGFVNIFLHPSYWHNTLATLLQKGDSYGTHAFGQGQKINVEYVSVNPTGPLHAGHGRLAVLGDALANLLKKVGFTVVKEFYINDCGGQIDTLAQSVHWRYCEILENTPKPSPSPCYQGSYIQEVARELITEKGDVFLHQSFGVYGDFVKKFSVDFFMKKNTALLHRVGIVHDVFTAESSFHLNGSIAQMAKSLQEKDYAYHGTLPPPKTKRGSWSPTPLLLFRATSFGDTSDRPLIKEDGTWTYFAADTAYHLNKIQRGFNRMINLWGADHGGAVQRLQGALEVLEAPRKKTPLDIVLVQMVHLVHQGQPLKMSKRTGEFVTLQEVVEKVGIDVFRFMMLTKKPDTHFDFDLEQALEASKSNPVFYVQYACARIYSVFRMAPPCFSPGHTLHSDPSLLSLEGAPLDLLEQPLEIQMIRLLSKWPHCVAQAATTYDVCALSTFLYDVASLFHELWQQGHLHAVMRFLIPHNWPLSWARLCLLKGVLLVLTLGLEIMGVSAPQEMKKNASYL